jgi:hypothetical protein
MEKEKQRTAALAQSPVNAVRAAKAVQTPKARDCPAAPFSPEKIPHSQTETAFFLSSQRAVFFFPLNFIQTSVRHRNPARSGGIHRVPSDQEVLIKTPFTPLLSPLSTETTPQKSGYSLPDFQGAKNKILSCEKSAQKLHPKTGGNAIGRSDNNAHNPI